jgi:molecular chaperone DnaK
MDRVIGIDLGTTNSVVAFTDPDGITEVIVDKGGDRIIPSVVYFPAGQDPVVGVAAKPYAVLEPERVAKLFKRGMGERTFLPDGEALVVDGHTWSPEELSSLVLRKLAGMAGDHLGEPVRRAVITVPAYFGEPERVATRSAGEIAGLEVQRIVNEPTAAAIAHGFDNAGEAGRLLVFDLGGGTFDVTIMDIGRDGALEVVATGGDREMGGADFDQLIYEEMVKAAAKAGMDITADPWTRQDAYAKAEDIKKELSTAESATRPITAGGRPIAFTLERAAFEKLLADRLRGVEDITLYTIEKANLLPSDLTKILMVGGSSRIPAFQNLLARICGRTPSFSRNLDEDVARGAAILATKLGGEANPRSQLATIPIPIDVASHGLGVSAIDERTGVMRNSVIIPAGTAIPAAAEETFSTVAANQTQIEVVLNEGDDDDLEFVRELGKSTGRFNRPVPKNHPIRVSMEYSAEQIIRVRAYDGRDDTFLCELEVKHEGNLSDREKTMARRMLANMEIK